MSEPLPPRPNLQWLKNRAKERLNAMRAADPATKLADALRAVAVDYGFTSWRQLKADVDARQAGPSFGRLGFVVFPSADLARSRAFYETSLGVSVISADASSLDLAFAGIRLRVCLHVGEYRRQHSGLQILIPGLEAKVETWRDAGVEFRSGIRQEPWGGRVITIADPDGNLFDAVDDEYANRLEAPAKPKDEKQILNDFRAAIRRGDAAAVEKLLTAEPVVRANVNAPIFDFDGRPIKAAATHPAVVDLLLAHGADINLRSAWWAGGFGVLDGADPATAEFLISRGAVVDIFAAAHLNRLDRVRVLLDADPLLVNAKGGDGGRPLHFASSVEMIDLLLDRGAEIDARDVDHESTPAQWHMPRRKQDLALVRHLVDRGAAVDVFMAAALGDVPRLTAMLAADPSLPDRAVGGADIPLCPKAPGEHMYVYKLDRGRTPVEVAAMFEATAAVELLQAHSSPRQRLLAACSAGDRAAVEKLLRQNPGLVGALDKDDLSRLPRAAWDGNAAAVQLMLDIGFDPATPGVGINGTVLHCAAWHGRLGMVRMILSHPAVAGRIAGLLAIRDAEFNATPFDWCCHGSTNRRAPDGDYAGVARALLAAGAVPGRNRDDASDEVVEVLRAPQP
jgi:ankyrin repeat protein/predicted enzyme related to lactoylglutathione lyase